MLGTSDTILDYVNHHCFNGKQSFDNFRVLDAGGGTGDATIYLAEQLRDRNAQVVYLDMTQKSLSVAQERAKIRGLDNIKWIHGSILSFPDMDIGKFDFINCCGVLHHLEDPQKGLAALKSVLNDNGAIAVMLYATYGRDVVYKMQSAMRLINDDEPNMQIKVDTTKDVLNQYPVNEWFKKTHQMYNDVQKYGDVGIYDLFLHSQDRSYTIGEVFEFIESCDLNFVCYGTWESHQYHPEEYLQDGSLKQKIMSFDAKKQSEISELLLGNIIKHSVLMTSSKSNTEVDIEDLDNVPFFIVYILTNLYELIHDKVGRELTLNRHDGKKITFTPTYAMCEIVKYLDGKRSLGDIFQKVTSANSDETFDAKELLDNFCVLYKKFAMIDWMMLRHKSLKPIKTIQEMHTERFK